MPSRAEVEQFFERRQRAWLAGDLDEYMSLWTEDVEFTTPDHGSVIHGRGALRDFIAANFESGAVAVSLDIDHFAVDGDVLLHEWSLVTKMQEGEAPETLRGMAVCGFRDGRVAWWRDYYRSS
jgi:uncharacterized protein (TIGR02246 family)